MTSKRVKFALPLIVLALLAGLFLLSRQSEIDGPPERLVLMTSLPIYWGEGADFGTLASGQGEIPWVREALERQYDLLPIDSLSAAVGNEAAGFDRLIIAQPRALSPQDNVTLDEWVNEGGRLLLVIDPLLTGSYSVPLGDPAHPMVIGLLPPVLERWGIGIRYDENQPFALQNVEAGDLEIPFAMAGEVYLLGSGSGNCEISHQGIMARCQVGQGRVTLLADAAIFEFHEDSQALRKSLSNLTELALE
jgi:hypothetical protein